MKKSVVGGLLCVAFFACDPGKDIPAMEVPSVVVNALKTKFPNASDLEWEIINDNYKAEFETASVDYHALIDPKGSLIKYKYEVNITDLPENVLRSIRQNYPDKTVEDAYLLKIGKDTYYEVEFETWLTENRKYFDPSGKRIEI